jgi:hypothetical protein
VLIDMNVIASPFRAMMRRVPICFLRPALSERSYQAFIAARNANISPSAASN